MPKKPVVTRRRRHRPGRRTRIRIPQPPDRPLQIRQRDLVKKEHLKEDTHWFTLHRRGVRRPRVGEDPLEARAVSKARVRGTLPERIVYQALVRNFHLSSTHDFDFQSSLQGGRVELGGIVCDFLFRFMKIALRVQGPTHAGYRRMKKDEEQRNALEEMGYWVHDIDLDIIFSEYELENKLRRIFAWPSHTGSAMGPHVIAEDPGKETVDYSQLWMQKRRLDYNIDQLIGLYV